MGLFSLPWVLRLHFPYSLAVGSCAICFPQACLLVASVYCCSLFRARKQRTSEVIKTLNLSHEVRRTSRLNACPVFDFTRMFGCCLRRKHCSKVSCRALASNTDRKGELAGLQTNNRKSLIMKQRHTGCTG